MRSAQALRRASPSARTSRSAARGPSGRASASAAARAKGPSSAATRAPGRLSFRRGTLLARGAQALARQTEQGAFETRMGFFREQLEQLGRHGEIVGCLVQQGAHRLLGKGVACGPENAQSDDAVRLVR